MMTLTKDLPAAAPPVTADRPQGVVLRDLRDEELMERLSHCDTAALEALYNHYGNLVYSTALRVLRDNHLAENISQEVFLRLWRQPERYASQKGRFVTWLLTVTRNRALDWLRTRRRRSRYETVSPEQREVELPASDAPDPALSAEAAERRHTVRAVMACLSPHQRQVIELAYFGGLSQREVADRLGQPLGTVKTRVRAAMQRLRLAFRVTDEALDIALGPASHL